MSFEFKRDETVERALRRIFREEIDGILSALTGLKRLSRDEAVHDSRKRLKKVRALLRLARDALCRKERRVEDAVLRDAGRALSDSRDAKALLDALDQLRESTGHKITPETFTAVRVKLLARRRMALKQQKEHQTGDVVKCLHAAQRRMRHCEIHGNGFTVLHGGLKRVYRQGRAAFAIARYDRDPATLHDWRKRVKDLQLLAQLLKPIWPEVLERFSGKAHELANCLGEDHDLFVLRQFLLHETAVLAAPMDLETLLESIDDRRRKLQQTAMTLGDRVYAEKPTDFLERMGNYWNAWSSGEAIETD